MIEGLDLFMSVCLIMIVSFRHFETLLTRGKDTVIQSPVDSAMISIRYYHFVYVIIFNNNK